MAWNQFQNSFMTSVLTISTSIQILPECVVKASVKNRIERFIETREGEGIVCIKILSIEYKFIIQVERVRVILKSVGKSNT